MRTAAERFRTCHNAGMVSRKFQSLVNNVNEVERQSDRRRSLELFTHNDADRGRGIEVAS